MKIKKIGHCCLLIKLDQLTILTDPGSFSDGQNQMTGIDLVLITHEHADHLHIESLKTVLANNPRAQILTNSAVGQILTAEGIDYQLLEGQADLAIAGIKLQAQDGRHEEIFKAIGQVQNTGYLINDRFFYPGDSFTVPDQSIEILALPVAGPWCRLADAINYALTVKPKIALPVHDGMLKEIGLGVVHRIPGQVLADHNIEFVAMTASQTKEFN